MLFVVCWIVGAIASWIGVTVYSKYALTTCTWKEFIEYVIAYKNSNMNEALKVLLYIVAWPVEVFCFVRLMILRNKYISELDDLDKESLN
jgi:hypothetical protein